ncbi:MAG: hypothetical protein A2Z66_07310 [Chloroflexi bacterium RBG_13_66_10]|nr:MAG: hypothetical protein A2Z66_07310 [Chloroflexi bacterium RBG_13_66_10]
MIRPFDWRDLSLLHRLRDRGLCLDSQQAYSQGPHALQYALLGALAPRGTAFTLVARPRGSGEAPAIGQLLQRNGDALLRLSFIAPAEALSQPAGLSLLDGLCQTAGARGGRNLVADVDEDNPAFISLREAGFAIYARQQVWRLEGDSQRPDGAGTGAMWRLEAAADSPGIHLLHLNVVPALVQQIEPPPARGRGLVHWREGEILGYLEIARGPLGIWTQPYFHPAAEKPDELLAGLLSQIGPKVGRPLYVCVRSYQSWLNRPLERAGFERLSAQAVMVKRLAVAVRRPALAPLPALEGTRVKPTTPMANFQKSPPAQSTERGA